MTTRFTLTRRAALLGAAGTLAAPLAKKAFSQTTPIKVGVLHSLSGTMAISETALRDTVLMMVEWQNSRGGINGRRLEAVVVDPASNWPLFAKKARELLQVAKVDVSFGCWTSVSRKSVLPVCEELNGLLFHPVQYEGEEESRNLFCTGAAPNQQAIPAVEYLMSADGGEAKRIALLGTDYVYPRTTNRILRAFLISKGIPEADIMEEYTPFGHSDWQGIVSRVKRFASEGKKTAIVSTINGDANVPFYRELGNQGIKAEDIPSVAFSVGAQDLAGILSHGQRQWLEIGMLLMQDPDLLLVDEPVAGMTDAETEHTAALLVRIAGQRSVVVVEHDLEFVKALNCRVTVLHEGSVLSEGSITHVQNDQRVIEVYLGR
jgi:urea transport system substrate-binding protein